MLKMKNAAAAMDTIIGETLPNRKWSLDGSLKVVEAG